MEPEGLLLCSQEPIACTHPQSVESSPLLLLLLSVTLALMRL
jgi:hypothetical protein